MRNNHVLELLVDLHDFEFHHAVNKYVVVANRLDVNLRTGQEGFEAEHFDDEATLGAALDVTVDDFATFVGFVDAVPRLEDEGFLVRKDELAVGAFLVLNVDFHLVAHLQVGVGAEFSNRNNTIRLETNVDDDFAVGDGHHSAFNDLVVSDLVHCACILVFKFLALVSRVVVELLVRRGPVEILGGNRLRSWGFHFLLNRLFSGLFNDWLFFCWHGLVDDVFVFCHFFNFCFCCTRWRSRTPPRGG